MGRHRHLAAHASSPTVPARHHAEVSEAEQGLAEETRNLPDREAVAASDQENQAPTGHPASDEMCHHPIREARIHHRNLANRDHQEDHQESTSQEGRHHQVHQDRQGHQGHRAYPDHLEGHQESTSPEDHRHRGQQDRDQPAHQERQRSRPAAAPPSGAETPQPPALPAMPSPPVPADPDFA